MWEVTYPTIFAELRVARGLLDHAPMSRWWLVLVLLVASATGWAEPVPPATVTTRAHAGTRALEARLARVTSQRAELARRYAGQLEAIDRLKRQRTSWRQQRELRESLASANDTAARLTAATSELAAATKALAAARRALIAAIDAELGATPEGARARELGALRARHAPAVQGRRVARIVLPELEVDPLADPEELDQQAAALRDSERQLQQQIVVLEQQARALDEVARLRRQHERAGELSRRDDDQPRKMALHGGAREAAPTSAGDASAPEGGAPGGSGGDGTGFGSGGAGFEAEASIVLAEVIEPSTIDTLTRAQRTGDPARRARAAQQTRDAVARRLEQIRRRRAEIEALAKARRARR